jgi:hypothetical protein
LTVAVDWSDAANAPTQHVNQFAGVIGPPTQSGVPDGVYLVMGIAPPPVIVGPDTEARRRVIEELRASGLKVTAYGRFHMSRERLGEIINVLQTTAAQYDLAVEMAREAGIGET